MDWLKKKKATINPKNDDDRCFQYAATIVLGYQEIRKTPQGIMKISPFINKYKYNWYQINFQLEKDDWVKLEKVNSTIALNMLYEKEKEICPAYISKYNLTHEKNPNGKGWQYVAVTKLSALLRWIPLNNAT